MNQLIPVNTDNDPLAADFAASQSEGGGGYLGYMKVMTFTSKEVTSGKAGAGDVIYRQGKEVLEVLGLQEDIIPLAYIMTATQYVDGKFHSYHNAKSDEYLQVKANSTSKDQELKKSNKHGPEFLVWLPSQEVFATIHLNTWSNRKCGDIIKAGIGNLTTVMSKKEEYKDFTYYRFDASASVSGVEGLAMPDPAAVDTQIEKFKSQKDVVPSEKSDPAEENGRER